MKTAHNFLMQNNTSKTMAKTRSINWHLLQSVVLMTVVLMSFIGLSFSVSASTSIKKTTADKNWHFTVSLDGDEIGYHQFTLIEKADNHKEIYSKARFDVKFLFFTAYSYRHKNVERWTGQCLNSIDALTDDNGDIYRLNGERIVNSFRVNINEQIVDYAACVKTFAYWDPEFLKETRLLNSQTGEMVTVKSEYIGEEKILNEGRKVSSKHYRLTGEDLQIDLWYSDNSRWLALESLTENGSIVRYAMNGKPGTDINGSGVQAGVQDNE